MASPRPRTVTVDEEQGVLFDTPREAQTSDDYWTPPWVFDRLRLRFDLDVAAPAGGVHWVPADRHFSPKDDGLRQPWHGRVWMNPPYSNPTPWVHKFLMHGNGIALLPTSTGAWFSRLWRADVSFVALETVRFHTNAGAMPAGLPSRCWLVAAGEDNKVAVARLGRSR